MANWLSIQTMCIFEKPEPPKKNLHFLSLAHSLHTDWILKLYVQHASKSNDCCLDRLIIIFMWNIPKQGSLVILLSSIGFNLSSHLAIPILVGGLVASFYFPRNIGLLIIPNDSYFSEGFFPNHQAVSIDSLVAKWCQCRRGFINVNPIC